MSTRTPTFPLFLSIVALFFAGVCGQSGPVASVVDSAAPEATATKVTSKKAPPPEDHAAEVDELFAFVTERAPGAALIVIKEGEVLYRQGYGVADRRRRTPITPQTAFHLASAGKQFTAMAIMMLHEEGELDYDDPIGAHLSELVGLGEEVTLRRLLTHTGGLPGHETGETDIYDALLDQVSEPTNEDLVAFLSDWSEEDLAYSPGEQYDYSNPGYELLGALVERVSGQPFGDFMEARIFGPLEMESTFSLPNPEKFALPNRARGYEAEDGEFTVYDSDPLDNLVGSGSIYSTVEDLYRYDQALYTNNLVSQETLAEAFQPAILNDGTEYPYGFGWELSEDEDDGYMGHSGYWEGYLAYILRYPEERLSVFVLSNRTDSDPESLAFEIAALYR